MDSLPGQYLTNKHVETAWQKEYAKISSPLHTRGDPIMYTPLLTHSLLRNGVGKRLGSGTKVPN